MMKHALSLPDGINPTSSIVILRFHVNCQVEGVNEVVVLD